MTNCRIEAVREELFIWYFSAPNQRFRSAAKAKTSKLLGKKLLFGVLEKYLL